MIVGGAWAIEPAWLDRKHVTPDLAVLNWEVGGSVRLA